MLSNLLQLLELIKLIVHQKISIISPHNDYLNFGNRDFNGGTETYDVPLKNVHAKI